MVVSSRTSIRHKSFPVWNKFCDYFIVKDYKNYQERPGLMGTENIRLHLFLYLFKTGLLMVFRLIGIILYCRLSSLNKWAKANRCRCLKKEDMNHAWAIASFFWYWLSWSECRPQTYCQYLWRFYSLQCVQFYRYTLLWVFTGRSKPIHILYWNIPHLFCLPRVIMHVSLCKKLFLG